MIEPTALSLVEESLLSVALWSRATLVPLEAEAALKPPAAPLLARSLESPGRWESARVAAERIPLVAAVPDAASHLPVVEDGVSAALATASSLAA